MEGGGWERPLEEKVDLEQHESGEQAVLQAHHFKVWSKSFQGIFVDWRLNPTQKLPLAFQIQFLEWSDKEGDPPTLQDQEKDSFTLQGGPTHPSAKTIVTSSSASSGLWSENWDQPEKQEWPDHQEGNQPTNQDN